MKDAEIKKIEKYIIFLKDCLSRGVANISINVENIDYVNDRKKVGYSSFMYSGDYSYFISRILFLSYIGEYSFFAGRQCIENYLKAYLKYKEHYPSKDIHDLDKLLELSRELIINNFINSIELDVIIKRFNPFYEIARYPIQRRFKPKNGQYSFLFPDDIKILDYFVYKMREVIIYPKNQTDILKLEAPFLYQEENRFLIDLFKKDNINFM